MPTPKKVIQLVQLFDRNLEAYRSGKYNETQVRHEFIDPFFMALGWDVNNEEGYAEAYKDVVHEDAVKVGGFTKAPDYCFRIGGTRKFFLEAKKPSVDIKDAIHPAYQLRRYAWSAKLPLSVLTDFEEFAVYDCRIKPVNTDKASLARTIYFQYTDYADAWDEIASIFSRDAVLKGSFDKYAESTRRKKGTAEVDAAFLKEIETWRDVLARNIALRNPDLAQRELNFAVQRTIDRIIFLRICEDRGIESYGRLMAITNDTQVYERLSHLFQQADDRYNSGLFHFRPEKDRAEPPDELTLSLAIDDKVLKSIIKDLYYPDSPYEFSVLPADILGQVYEQFLGKVIRLTKGHRAVVEDKPEVKKAGGVYYTPTYIVDYIVENTVGRLLEEKTPRQVAGTRSRPPLRVLDPACGSGSFLIGAYQHLLDWHRDRYVEDGPQKWAKRKPPRVYQGRGGEWRLTTAERKRILINHIYGVDIDPQAVEVTKLSLLLKVLEGESGETIGKNLELFHERALPDLSNNIKCGNSLIGPDFYDNRQLDLLDDEERYRINVFDWQTEFPSIMKSGGFDVVIGNPPYVRQESLKEQKRYFHSCYRAYHGVADLYVYFIEKGLRLLKPTGLFGVIVSNKWMRVNYGKPLRCWMKQQRIEEIVDFGVQPVFWGPTTYTCILRIRNDVPQPTFESTQVKTLDFDTLQDHVRKYRHAVNQAALSDEGWSLVDKHTQSILDNLRTVGVSLSEYVKGQIYYGVKTGLNKAFVIDAKTHDQLIAEDSKCAELIKPFLVGRDIKRYRPPSSKRYLILVPKGWTRIHSGGVRGTWEWFQQSYPAIATHLAPFADEAQKRYDKGEYWWELRACDYYDEFQKPKIFWPGISAEVAAFALDDKHHYGNDNTQLITTDDRYLLGILNSCLSRFILTTICDKVQGGFYRLKMIYIQQLPIRSINFDDPEDVAHHDRMVKLVEEMLSLHKQLAAAKTAHDKTTLQRQIDATDRQIDRLVYELYELTEEEIAIVEDLQ